MKYLSDCCHAIAKEDFRENICDHHDPIEIYTCSKCGEECDANFESSEESEKSEESENCPLLLAGDYQYGFNRGWIFLGFDSGHINWFQI